MKFDLKRPCTHCPFRYDIPGYLTQAKAEEIIESIAYRDESFPCHKTLDFNNTDEEGDAITTGEEQHCAGALILLEHMDSPNQMMRIAERIGLYDRRKLDMESPVFDDEYAFTEHHEHATRRRAG